MTYSDNLLSYLASRNNKIRFEARILLDYYLNEEFVKLRVEQLAYHLFQLQIQDKGTARDFEKGVVTSNLLAWWELHLSKLKEGTAHDDVIERYHFFFTNGLVSL